MFFTKDNIAELGKEVRRLNILKSEILSKSIEFNHIESEYKSNCNYFQKSNSSLSLFKSIQTKYDKARKNYLSVVKKLEVDREKCQHNIDTIIKKNRDLATLLHYESFLTDDQLSEITINLAKAHEQKLISDERLRKALSDQKKFKRLEVGGKTVYVKDSRTQYADIIVINDRNELLFCVRNKNDEFEPSKYCLPGGHVESDENPKAAAVRELAEETGITVDISKVQEAGNYIDNKVNIHYYTVMCNEEPLVLEEREQTMWEWVPIEDVDKRPLILNLEENLRTIIDLPRSVINPLHPYGALFYQGGPLMKAEENIQLQRHINVLHDAYNEGTISKGELDSALISIPYPIHRFTLLVKGKGVKHLARLLPNDLEKSEEDELEKGKKAQIGEERLHGGVKVRKTAEGWVPVSENKEPKSKEDSSSESEKTEQTINSKYKPGTYSLDSELGRMFSEFSPEQEEQVKEEGVNYHWDDNDNLVIEGESESYSDEELQKFAREATDEGLQRAAQGGNEQMRRAAKSEIARREKDENPESPTFNTGEESQDNDPTKPIQELENSLNNEYKETVESLLKPEVLDNEKSLNQLSIKQKKLANYTRILKQDKLKPATPEELKKSYESLGLKNETELQQAVGDGKILSIDIEPFGSNTLLSTVTEDCYVEREFDPKEKNVDMAFFTLNPLLETGQGKGSEIFNNEVHNFKKMGYKTLTTGAAKSDVFNGYYTWAVLGYEFADEKDQQLMQQRAQESNNEKIRNAKTLSDMVSFKDGADWWRENGFEFLGKFDLNDNSQSMKLLTNYIQNRKTTDNGRRKEN